MAATRDWIRSVTARERRTSLRRSSPALVAFYWNGGAPTPHPVRDISHTGFTLRTPGRWFPGTVLMITLQRTDGQHDGPAPHIAVQARVVRADEDGVAFAFVLPQTRPRSARDPQSNGADRKMLVSFLKQLRTAQGQALIEYILMLPLVLILIMNVVNFGGFFYAWITVADAARAGADYAILGGASLGDPAAAGATAITNVITQDIASLPNSASLAVNICQNNNGTTKTLSGTCTSLPADPEPASFVLTSIDVTYTYLPFIPAGFQFQNLNIYVTIPPTSIHRRAVMRVQQ